MKKAKLFKNGDSQAVRLPKEFRFPGKEVYIKRQNGAVILMPTDNPWQSMLDSLDRFSDDVFTDGRKQPPLQDREAI